MQVGANRSARIKRRRHRSSVGLIDRVARRLIMARSRTEKGLYELGWRSAAGLTLPHFLGIGAQKSGTTWLFENLRCHPGVYMPNQKELHYFDRQFETSLKSYARRFEPGRDKVRGEITPGYSTIAPAKIRFIRKVMPDLKMIFLMRNPIERAWSQALMNLVKLPGRAFETVSDDEFYAHFTHPRSVRRGEYLRILNRWMSVFPPEQFYLGFFEDVTGRPKELLSAIFTHIGVTTDVDWNRFPYASRVLEGVGVRMPDKFRTFLEEMYCRDIEALYERFGAPVEGWRCRAGD